ncbi:Glutamine-dependent NAD(+) synthetase [Paraconexibacter sp. AEG42_29]|uniref:Glutamine-dependent NAD(+) synthetase n=1 Tax=Paraconexibacter sp. AEG42_29 TaxID=2997339 RepID=A0AAU7AZH9_9ACTN
MTADETAHPVPRDLPRRAPAADPLLRVALAQQNAVVGDPAANAAGLAMLIQRAQAAGAQLVVAPELAISGYPPEDLLLHHDFVRACQDECARLAAAYSKGIVAIVGCPWHDARDRLVNAAVVMADGAIQGVVAKTHLPNYGVFDERRYFAAGDGGGLLRLGPWKVGITICEDLWVPAGPVADCARGGAQLVVNLSASPYHHGKLDVRERLVGQRAADSGCAIAYTGLVGGQDELVFDGGSLAVDHLGGLIARGDHCAEDLVVVDFDLGAARAARHVDIRLRDLPAATIPTVATLELQAVERVGPPAPLRPRPDRLEEVWGALRLGLRDYLHKQGFERVVLGMSGGVDSALVADLACDALGAGNVQCIVMPGPHSSTATQDDARALTEALGALCATIPIAPVYEAATDALAGAGLFDTGVFDVANENTQSRARMIVLMAYSNRHGAMLLSTGNKSEMSTGYATYAGDMTGGFNPLKDVPKLLCFDLAHWRAGLVDGPGGAVYERIATRPPSAELRPDQRDDQSLPPYERLDPILRALVEERRGVRETVALGHDPREVALAARLIRGAEFKRRQAPTGVKITPVAFGRDRRMPIANRWLPPVDPLPEE